VTKILRLAFCLAALITSPFVAALAAPGDLRPLCPDRPGKGTSPCTVDPGHFQIEIDAYDTTAQRSGGAYNRVTIIGNPAIKYGLTGTIDIEASLAPYEERSTHNATSRQALNGQGDLYLRTKWNFLGDASDGKNGPLSAVIEPFVKIATATRGLGNGATEGGVVLPLAYDLGNSWSLSSTPEADILRNASDTGRHATAIDVIGLGRALDGGIALGAEVWTSQDFDPRGTTSQYSFDLDTAWQPPASPNLQLDAGVNFGLNKNTPVTEFYLGVSQRF
jgi:hypothetical protein